MGVGWAAALSVDQPGTLVRLARAMCEAGIVGGLADWFAVTALFRHPLGLPIPHTAILPANKERLAATLGSFIADNFLTRELVLRKVRELGIGRRMAQWLAAPETAPALSGWLVATLPPIVRGLESAELRELVGKTIGHQLGRIDIAPAVTAMLRRIAGSREADMVLAQLGDAMAGWLDQNRPRILAMVEARSRWWIPKAIDRQVAAAIADGLSELIDDLRRPGSQPRARLLEALDQLAREIVESPERRAGLQALVMRVLADETLGAWLAGMWRTLAENAVSEAADPASTTRLGLEKVIASAGAALGADPAFVARIDALADRLALVLVARRRDAAAIVDEVVRGWDSRTMADRLELAVGSDLQFIRMNGTLVGAAVGGLLFLSTLLVEHLRG